MPIIKNNNFLKYCSVGRVANFSKFEVIFFVRNDQFCFQQCLFSLAHYQRFCQRGCICLLGCEW